VGKGTKLFLLIFGILGLCGVAVVYLVIHYEQAKPKKPMPKDFKGLPAHEHRKRVELITGAAKSRKALEADPAKGIPVARDFIKRHAGSGEALEIRIALAKALAKTGEPKAAVAVLNVVIGNPKAGRQVPRALLCRAEILADSDEAAARRDLARIIQGFPDQRDLQMRARLALGRIELKQGNFHQAIEFFNKVANSGIPEKAQARIELRKAILQHTKQLIDKGQWQAFVGLSEEMIKRFPDLAALRHVLRFRQAAAYRNLAVASGKASHLVKARGLLERLCRDVPKALLSRDIERELKRLLEAIDCQAELKRLAEAEEAIGILRTPGAFLRAKSEGKEKRAHFGGEIAADTTWGRDRSPLVLTGVVTVKEGATLTVEPGVTVQFLLGTRLVVEGALVARGTAEQPVRFTSAIVNKAARSCFDGEGIEFADQSAGDRCRLEYCIIEYQRTGAACRGASPVIRQCTFTRNGTVALLATRGAEPCIEGTCRFERNDGAAIRAENATIAIRRCLILNNGRDGIQLEGKAKAVIEANRINRNGGAGIACENNASPKIQGNEIASNKGDGIYCNRFSKAVIQGNVIRDNHGAGITCRMDSPARIVGNLIEANRGYPIVLRRSDGVIRGNHIRRNRPYGIHCESSASPRIEGNWIEDNGGCNIICAEASAPIITQNAILGRSRLISNTGATPIQAKENYFGKITDKELAEKIFDKNDQDTLGEVFWRPRLTEPPPPPPEPKLDLPPLL